MKNREIKTLVNQAMVLDSSLPDLITACVGFTPRWSQMDSLEYTAVYLAYLWTVRQDQDARAALIHLRDVLAVHRGVQPASVDVRAVLNLYKEVSEWEIGEIYK